MADSNGATGAEWGASVDMTPWEGIMWRAEVDPLTRSSGALVEILDREPDWDRLVAAHERVTRAIPRLRDRVVEPIVPLVPPAFTRDERFDVRNHLHRIRLGSATMRDLLDLTESLYDRPFQPGRPPWEGLLVEGLEGGRAAYVLKLHHSLTDGQGLVQLLSMAHSRTREPSPHEPEPPLPPSEQLNSVTLLASRLRQQATSFPGRLLHQAGESARLAGRTITEPTEVIGDGIRYARSLMRVLSPPPVARSPLLAGNRGRDAGSWCSTSPSPTSRRPARPAADRSTTPSWPRCSAASADSTSTTTSTSISCPWRCPSASARPTTPPAGTGSPAPGSPARWVSPTRGSASRRSASSCSTPGPSLPSVCSKSWLPPSSQLPAPVLVALTATMTSVSDVQASNIPGLGHTAYLAGAKITHTFPFGPRPGVAAMVTMLSYDGNCCIGFNVDPGAITDTDVFETCMREGFDEVLELGTP